MHYLPRYPGRVGTGRDGASFERSEKQLTARSLRSRCRRALRFAPDPLPLKSVVTSFSCKGLRPRRQGEFRPRARWRVESAGKSKIEDAWKQIRIMAFRPKRAGRAPKIAAASLKRVPDCSGARWPVTGHWCEICGWPSVIEGPHPTCTDEPPGAQSVQNRPGPINVWRRSREPVVDLDQAA